MKHLQVHVLLVIVIIISQVNSGIILGRITDTLGNIKCKVHNLGENIIQHGHHHDPCAPAEDHHPDDRQLGNEGYLHGQQGQNWHDNSQLGHVGYGDDQFGHGDGHFHGHYEHDHQAHHHHHHGHHDHIQGQNGLGNGQEGRFHGQEENGHSHTSTEKPLNNNGKISGDDNGLTQDNGNGDPKQPDLKAIDQNVNTYSKHDVDQPSNNDLEANNEIDVPIQKVLSPRNISTPALDVRINDGDEVERMSPKTKQDGRRILGNVKTNCPDGTIADASGVCREIY